MVIVMSKTDPLIKTGIDSQVISTAPSGDIQLGSGGELHQLAGGEHSALTTNQGVGLSDNQNSLRANPKGPTLMEDFIFHEK